VELPDGRTLTIGREARDRGGDIVWTRLGEQELDDDGLAHALAEAFGASREFLSMTTLLSSDAVADDAAGAFHLQTHLRRVFGVEDLQQAAEAVRRLHTEAGAAARQLREASRQGAADLSRLRAELDVAAASSRLIDARGPSPAALSLAEGELRQAGGRGRGGGGRGRKQLRRAGRGRTETLGRGARLGRPPTGRAGREGGAAEVAAAEGWCTARRRPGGRATGRGRGRRDGAGSRRRVPGLHLSPDESCTPARPTTRGPAGATEFAGRAGRVAQPP
jgi:hypothetical protein